MVKLTVSQVSTKLKKMQKAFANSAYLKSNLRGFLFNPARKCGNHWLEMLEVRVLIAGAFSAFVVSKTWPIDHDPDMKVTFVGYKLPFWQA